MRLAILGSTGSIGHSALAVVDAHADRLQVIGLAAGTSATAMALQVERYRPRAVVMATDAACETLRGQLPTGAAAHLDLCGAGPQALIDLVTRDDVDTVLCASSGTAALEAVVAAIAPASDRARQQGSAGDGGPPGDGPGAGARRRRAAGRQRAQRHPPVPAPARSLGSAPADPDGIGRPVPAPVRRGAGRRHRRRRAQPSDLADGPRRSPSTRRR